MKKYVRILAFALFLIMLCGCNTKGPQNNDPPAATDNTENKNTEDTDDMNEKDTGASAPESTAAPSDTDRQPHETTEDMIDTPKPEAPKSIKILAIGNSFSTDTMQYLYDILKDGGIEDIVLGNLYYGGCSLDQHYIFHKGNSPSYKYYKNTTGKWEVTDDYRMSAALVDEKWDYVSLQQTSKTCGIASSYSRLDDLIAVVKAKCPDSKLMFNMTWAYQQDSTHSSFPNYDRDQMKMYNMTIDVTKEVIEPLGFDVIIPCMTSIQNARTSFMGDTLTRDGFHLDYYIGRYIAGLTWYSAITGLSVDDIEYNPSTGKINADMIKAAKEAVKNAIAEPLKITESTVKTGERPDDDAPIEDPNVKLDPVDFFEADKALASKNNVDLTNYTLLEWGRLDNTYWNCTSKPGTTTPGASAGTYHQNVCSDKKYSLGELPHGTIFILDSGWQYRLELYTDESSKYTGARPPISSKEFFVLDDAFTKDANYIAWNISSNPKSDISQIYEQASCHLRIYVPNN